MHFPDHPSALRKILLAPAALLYAAGSFPHRALRLRPHARDRARSLPLVVIGSLRAGGAGKTAVTLELARHLKAGGRRVGILAYWIRKTGGARGRAPLPAGDGMAEVFPDADWRACSDEAVLLARGAEGRGGARVFVTRDRERAWDALSRAGEFDVLLSDDGLMDPRLRGAFRVVIAGPDERPGIFDLLPAGPYRLTAAALRGANAVLHATPPSFSPLAGGDKRGGYWFHREVIPPPGGIPEEPCWIVCGLGNPPAFLRSLKNAGVRVAGFSAGADHGLPDLDRARRDARRAGANAFLCSGKDGIKLENHPSRPDNLLRVGEKITLSRDFLEAVEGFLPPPTS